MLNISVVRTWKVHLITCRSQPIELGMKTAPESHRSRSLQQPDSQEGGLRHRVWRRI